MLTIALGIVLAVLILTWGPYLIIYVFAGIAQVINEVSRLPLSPSTERTALPLHQGHVHRRRVSMHRPWEGEGGLMMKDKHHIWTYLREQLQGHSELWQSSRWVGDGTGQRCFACDETIRKEHSVTIGYPLSRRPRPSALVPPSL